MHFYDISDRAHPRETGSFTQDGLYIAAWLSGGNIYLAGGSSAYYNRGTVEPQNVVPYAGSGGKTVILPAGDIVVPPGTASDFYDVISSMSMSGGGVSSKAVLGGGEIYASENYVYLAQEHAPAAGSKAGPKAAAVTDILRFSLKNGPIAQAGSAQLPAWAMDEYSGCLRVFTTQSPNTAVEPVNGTESLTTANGSAEGGSMGDSSTGGGTAVAGRPAGEISPADPGGATGSGKTPSGSLSSGIYILDSNMKITGRLEGLEHGIGFIQPLFAGSLPGIFSYQNGPLLFFDLSDPKSPKSAGKIQSADASEYLLPCSDDQLLGLSNAVEPTGIKEPDGGTGSTLRLSLYDVSNPDSPKVLYTYGFGGNSAVTPGQTVQAGSQALGDLRALLILKDQGIIGIPVTTLTTAVQTANQVSQTDTESYCIIGLDPKTGFSLKGVITQNGSCQSPILRGFCQGGVLYTLSQAAIEAASLDGVKTVFARGIPIDNATQVIYSKDILIEEP